MHDQIPPDNAAHQALAFLALLYASGELEGAEATAFEERLGEDPAAREALCQAVQLSLALTGQGTAGPDPAYRARVRRRLQQPGFWQALTGRQVYRCHPAVWSGLGAAAAVLLIVLWNQAVPTVLSPTPPVPLAHDSAIDHSVPTPAAATWPMIEVASFWADLHNSEHLEKVHTEEVRRRLRSEERFRLVRTEERTPRLLDSPPTKQ